MFLENMEGLFPQPQKMSSTLSVKLCVNSYTDCQDHKVKEKDFKSRVKTISYLARVSEKVIMQV